MVKEVSKNLSFEGWKIWLFIKGRKKLLITVVGLIGVQLAFDPELIGLLAGGAIFEGIWSILEYFFKRTEIK